MQDSDLSGGELPNSSLEEGPKQENTSKIWNLTRPEFTMCWHPNPDGKETDTNKENESVEVPNGIWNSFKRRQSRRKRPRRRLIQMLVGFGVVIAILVPIIVILVLRKGDDADTVESVFKVDIEATILNMHYTDALADKESPEHISFGKGFCSEIEKQYEGGDFSDSYVGCDVTEVRNGSLRVTFTVVFISHMPPLQSRVKSVLTRNRVTLDNGQEQIRIGEYVLEEESLVVGQVTVVKTDENSVPTQSTSARTEAFIDSSQMTSSTLLVPTPNNSSTLSHQTMSTSTKTDKYSISSTTISSTSLSADRGLRVVLSQVPLMNKLEIGQVELVIFEVVDARNAAVITLEQTTESAQVICNITFSNQTIEKTYGLGRRAYMDVSVDRSEDQAVANVTLKFSPVYCNAAAKYTCRVTPKDMSTESAETSVDMDIYRKAEKPHLTLSYDIVNEQDPLADRPSICEGEVGLPAGYFVVEVLTFGSFTNYTDWWPLKYTMINATDCGTYKAQPFVFYQDELDYLNGKQIRCAVRNDNPIPDENLPVSDAKTIHVVQSDYCEDNDWKFYEHPYECHAFVDCSTARPGNMHFKLCGVSNACPNRDSGCDAANCSQACSTETLTREERCINGEELIPHPTECHKYYECSLSQYNETLVYDKFCPYQQLFSTYSLQCTHFEMVDCGQRKELIDRCDYSYNTNGCRFMSCIPCEQDYPSCKGKPDGMHVREYREWSPYFITCYKQRLMSTGYCPQASDGLTQFFHVFLRKCIPIDMVSQEYGGIMPNCTGKVDGNYPDDVGRCNRFTVCRSGEIETLVKCEEGEVFDALTRNCLAYESACGPCGESKIW